MATGDAVGTTCEFEQPGTFAPVSEMVGGGVFKLKAGEWTDDTSMGLCLAESLIEMGKFDPRDQLQRYVLAVAANQLHLYSVALREKLEARRL